MRRRHLPEIADGLLVVGLALGAIGLGAVVSALTDLDDGRRATAWHVAQTGCLPCRDAGAERARNPFVLPQSSPVTLPPRSNRLSWQGPAGKPDVRDFLLESASEARGGSRNQLFDREIQSDLWLNDPMQIGSTSPP